jgi:hypothetical protein
MRLVILGPGVTFANSAPGFAASAVVPPAATPRPPLPRLVRLALISGLIMALPRPKPRLLMRPVGPPATPVPLPPPRPPDAAPPPAPPPLQGQGCGMQCFGMNLVCAKPMHEKTIPAPRSPSSSCTRRHLRLLGARASSCRAVCHFAVAGSPAGFLAGYISCPGKSKHAAASTRSKMGMSEVVLLITLSCKLAPTETATRLSRVVATFFLPKPFSSTIDQTQQHGLRM